MMTKMNVMLLMMITLVSMTFLMITMTFIAQGDEKTCKEANGRAWLRHYCAQCTWQKLGCAMGVGSAAKWNYDMQHC
jgi:hypothetical protein